MASGWPVIHQEFAGECSGMLVSADPSIFVDSHLTTVTVWEMTPGSGGAASGEAW